MSPQKLDGESADDTKVTVATVRQALKCPCPSLCPRGPQPTTDSFIRESTQHRFRNKGRKLDTKSVPGLRSWAEG